MGSAVPVPRWKTTGPDLGRLNDVSVEVHQCRDRAAATVPIPSISRDWTVLTTVTSLFPPR